MKSEVDLARHAVSYLTDHHWEVFQEVERAGCRADIVARLGKLIFVVECKTSFSLDVLAQAHQWLPYGNFVSVAVPNKRRRYKYCRESFCREVCEHLGLGVMLVSSGGDVTEFIKPRFRRRIADGWKLVEEQKTFAPAGSNGGYYTPFQATSRRVSQFVASMPGCTVKDIISSVAHHYQTPSTFRSTLVDLARKGVFRKVRIDETNGIRFYPE